MHTSYLDSEDFGKVPCNGMLYQNNNEVIIFDTPVTAVASQELIHWVGDKDIKALVATHFHEDCVGGLEVFHKNGVPSYANRLTIRLADQSGNPKPRYPFEKKMEFQIGAENVIAQYAGQGHTVDNSIGYIRSEKALFGGCLIKAMGAGEGNLQDANIEAWPKTVVKLKEDFPNLEIVIPGHGNNGGKELLDYTVQLFTEQ